ncbi:hypothetical protein [Salinirubrum litoreum]|uniref:Uncharacterized protein n=1 Tax=Salinirubrum litoreum TaxID=1126234 RepID=A0ABD5RH22_9EURY|nr:hypothetical protein [Salinirubrum litoreum]
MADGHHWSPVSRSTVRAFAAGGGLSVLYTAIVLAYSAHPATNVSVAGSLWVALAVQSAMALGTVGVPVFLWERYDIRSPGALLVVLLVFWHILVEFPPIGTGQGDSPGFLFVFAGAPLYVVLYAVLASGEVVLRRRGVALGTR